jgi:hypothetical protein
VVDGGEADASELVGVCVLDGAKLAFLDGFGGRVSVGRGGGLIGRVQRFRAWLLLGSRDGVLLFLFGKAGEHYKTINNALEKVVIEFDGKAEEVVMIKAGLFEM